MTIANAKSEATTMGGLPHIQTHLSTQPLTWQHGIKSLAYREQINGNTVR